MLIVNIIINLEGEYTNRRCELINEIKVCWACIAAEKIFIGEFAQVGIRKNRKNG